MGLFRKKSLPNDKPVAKQEPAPTSASDRLITHALAKGAVVQEDDRTAFLGNVLVSIQLHGKETREARQLRYRAAMTALESTTDWRLPLGPGLWLLGVANGHTAVYETLAGSLEPKSSSFTVIDLTSGQGYAWDGRTNRAVEVAPTSFGEENQTDSRVQGQLLLNPEANTAAMNRGEASSPAEKMSLVSSEAKTTPLNVASTSEPSASDGSGDVTEEAQPTVGTWPGAERFVLIGLTDEGELANVIQQAPENGRKLAGLAATLPGETTPRSLIAYANPDGRVQVTSLFSFDREANMLDFMTSFPSSEDGLRYNLTATEVAVSTNGLEAEISAANESGSSIKFFDTRFFAHQRRYRLGQPQPFILLAFACQIDVVRSAIKAKTASKETDLPAPCNWQASGRVKTVSRYLTLGRAFTRLLVAFKSDSDRDFDLIVHAADGVIKGAEPQVGDLIEAQLWVQGFLVATQSDLAVD